MTPLPFAIALGVLAIVSALPFLRAIGPLKPLAGALLSVCRSVVKGAFAIAAPCLLLLALAQLGAIVTRNIFAVNFIWLQESALYLFGAGFLLAGGAILLIDGHVRVDVFYSRWTVGRQRIVDLIGLYLFVVPVGLLIVFAAGPYVAASWAALEGSSDPSGIPAVFLLKTLVPVFGALLVLAAAVRAGDLLDGRAPIAPPDDATGADT